MADETTQTPPVQSAAAPDSTVPSGTPENPVIVKFADTAGGIVLPAEGLDVTQPGGIYRVGGQLVDAEGNPTKPARR